MNPPVLVVRPILQGWGRWGSPDGESMKDSTNYIDRIPRLAMKIAELELDAHTKDAFYGEKIAELEATLSARDAEIARLNRIIHSETWLECGWMHGSDFRKKLIALGASDATP